MRAIRRMSCAVTGAVLAIGAAIVPAQAMGSGNPYEDMQVGVTYTVYQPSYTGGLSSHGTGSAPCTDGSEQNTIVLYGKASKAQLAVWEGNPICADPAGAGKTVAKPKVLGATATVQAYCDPSIASQWASCSTKDVAIHGGSLQVTLPASGSLRPTKLVLVNSGKHPLSYDALVKVARSMKPILTSPTLVGGMVQCTQGEFANSIEAGLPKGQRLVSVDSYKCADGWAYAVATVGDGKGNNITVTDVFEAEGQFWIPKDRAKVCGTISPSAPATRPADSQVPASLWAQACNTN